MSSMPVLTMQPPHSLNLGGFVTASQQSAAEVTLGAFPGWVTEDHAASTLDSCCPGTFPQEAPSQQPPCGKKFKSKSKPCFAVPT